MRSAAGHQRRERGQWTPVRGAGQPGVPRDGPGLPGGLHIVDCSSVAARVAVDCSARCNQYVTYETDTGQYWAQYELTSWGDTELYCQYVYWAHTARYCAILG